VEEQVVVGHGLFEKLLEQEKFGAVDDSVDASSLFARHRCQFGKTEKRRWEPALQ
jgi:hypothetical protein